MRSESERISSSSSEMSRIARPLSRSSTRRRCRYSIAPTSSPRVGWAAISTFGFREISRAAITFCWFPPERPPARVSAPPPRLSNSLISFLARSTKRAGKSQQHLPPDHHPRQRLLGRRLALHGVDLLAAPEHGDPVGDLEHFVQLVADEDDRGALGSEHAHDLEQLLRLLRREHRCRLVQDEDV